MPPPLSTSLQANLAIAIYQLFFDASHDSNAIPTRRTALLTQQLKHVANTLHRRKTQQRARGIPWLLQIFNALASAHGIDGEIARRNPAGLTAKGRPYMEGRPKTIAQLKKRITRSRNQANWL